MKHLIQKYEQLLAESFHAIERDCYSGILDDLKAIAGPTYIISDKEGLPAVDGHHWEVELLGAEVRTKEMTLSKESLKEFKATAKSYKKEKKAQERNGLPEFLKKKPWET